MTARTTTTTMATDARRRQGGAALVLGPAPLVTGAFVHPREVSDAGEQRQIVAGGLHRWYLAHLLYVAANVVRVPAVLAIGRRLRDRAPRLELWGTGLAVVGLFCTASLVAVEGFGGWQVSDRAAATAAFDRITTSAGIIVPFAMLGLTLSARLVVLAVGLRRTHAAPAWVVWTLGAGAGAVVLAVGLVGELYVAFLAGVLSIAAALAAIGLDDLGLAPSTATVGMAARGPLATNG